MANGHGGQRTPNNPAPVSGPGALSRRTDWGATQPPMLASGGEYGSRQEMQAIQSGAPLQGGGGAPAPAPIPLDAETQYPDEPITAGADEGDGMGMGAAGIGSPGATEIDDATRQRLLGHLPTLLWLASQPKASEQTRQFVRQLRADL